MKKPKKKKDIGWGETAGYYINGYNDACDEWEAYHKQEIKTLTDWYKEWADSLSSGEPMDESPLNGEA